MKSTDVTQRANPEKWKRFKQLVVTALEQERTQWPSFLAAQCGEDVDLFSMLRRCSRQDVRWVISLKALRGVVYYGVRDGQPARPGTQPDLWEESPMPPDATSEDLTPDALEPSITRLLHAWSDGDADALNELVPLVCDELRQMARRYLNRESKDHVLQPTALVDEFFLRLLKRRTVSWNNRAHFFGFAAQTMRVILVDNARRQNRHKRGSGEAAVSLGQELEEFPTSDRAFELLEVHEALDQLEEVDERAAAVVKMRFFVGMTVKETGAALDISPATVKREWEFAKLWLYHRLHGD